LFLKKLNGELLNFRRSDVNCEDARPDCDYTLLLRRQFYGLMTAAEGAESLRVVLWGMRLGCVRRPPGTPLRECPPLRSSFISLRGAPGALRTMGAAVVLADQPLR